MKYLLIAIALLMSTNVMAESESEKMERYRAAFEQCGVSLDKYNSPSELACLKRKSIELNGSSSYKESDCRRGSEIYLGAAMNRDNKIPLSRYLRFIKKWARDTAPKLMPNAPEEVIRRTNNGIEKAARYVYANPHKSGEQLKFEQYSKCMTK